MTGLRVVLAACLVCLCGIAWGATPTIAAGGRISIIEIVTRDVIHFHIGRAEVNNFKGFGFSTSDLPIGSAKTGTR
ncbi:MAG: hypothetical protein WDO68_28360 [Gammaproteobacteria bacterium]